MKTITAGLKAHMALTVTTLAMCWRLERLDGAVFAFTTLDADLLISGVLYKSIVGFSRTAIVTGSHGAVDNLEVLGFFDPSGIVEQDLKNGLFNWATVYLFVVNWADLSMGICRMRRGWLGETTRLPSGSFRAELRGLQQALVQEFGNVISPLCRADLGDSKCLIPILPPAWLPGVAYAAGTWVCAATKSSTALQQAIFQCSTAGTAGSSEPTWNTTVGATTADLTPLVWTSGQPLRLIGTVTAPVSAHQFVVTPLLYPAGQTGTLATIIVQNNVSGGTAMEISDGVNAPALFTFPFDTPGATAVAEILSVLATAGLAMTVTHPAPLIIQLLNTSGKQGNIVKTGDIALPPALVINNFAPGYLEQGTVTWITGQNAGVSMELKLYDTDTTSVVLWLGMLFPITAGDTFWYHPGCDKRRETCWQKFDNILNFRGEPDVPGLDRMLGYPDSGA